MKAIKTILFFSTLMLVFSCGPTVRTVNPEATNVNNYDTFAYLPNTNADLDEKEYNDETINKGIVEAVKNNLQQEGFELYRDNPDLLVLIRTARDTEIATTTDPVYATYPYTTGVTAINPYYNPYYYYGYNDVVGYDLDTYAYKEGTLVINLIDRQTKNTVWKGVANNTIYDQTSSDAIERMINDIFESFPEG
ncbi:uncharacterized protein DUF4136 [Salegentibacter sp. 24]|uniref:DUF4136 domain-containing protein n=1 Tax=Salegentibacter sp. 24 TaxID=2183986 RepID=UPI001061288B|nr:DUF4136 domain-containing protein [Salegentibacter sp. 24]TDN83073.1 uncharacterized protein DUF4136 [Salegentibacter sp. 24]